MIVSKMVYEKDEFDLRPLGLILDDEEPGDDDTVMSFWLHNRVFTCERHKEVMEPCAPVAQTWRMKERMKTVSVALVLCLNVGVDPPDLVKISPCARLQCWIDPQQFGDPSNDTTAQKAIDVIGTALQKQYERWQPRARYKLSLDPTVEDVKKLCTSLRRNAKEERVLFHYNGHGVPRPTPNGEIWVFNKHYTQYIPLSMCDLRMWMGSPSIYVFDCSNAGNVVEYLRNPPNAAIFKESDVDQYGDHDTSDEVSGKSEASYPASNPKSSLSSGSFILLAACQSNETLPLNSGLPADLFTACLTTPIKIALKWYVLSRNSRLVPEFTAEQADRIPGLLHDRRTMLGELNWIFTAITDTIAWNVLSRELFQKLFRQDLLVASLFRNFLLAERIMHYYNCSPISVPLLPPTRHHFMWMAWDYALDGVLKQLPNVLANPASFKFSSFFSDQLTGFEMWLRHAMSLKISDVEWRRGNMAPPEQLPIVLQVLLSQVHRQRALELLGKFLNLGQWAASLALSVGIFPYVLKLLQSSAQELKSLLVFIWAKLIAIDSSCQADLIKDNSYKYFLDVLADLSMEAETRMTAAFVVAMMVDNFRPGQQVAVTNNIISLCLLQTTDPHPGLRQWVVLCLGKVWWKYDDARWRGVRDAAHEKLFPLLQDPIPEVRAATVYCLGSLMANTTKRDDQVIKIDNAVTTGLLSTLYDGSPIVRKELVVALAGYVVNFYAQFEKIASENFKKNSYHTVTGQDAITMKGRKFKLPRSNSASDLTADANSEACSLKHISNISPLQTLRSTNIPNNVWNSLVLLQNDPHPMVGQAATKLCEEVLKTATKKGRGSQERHFGQMKQTEETMDELDDPICHHPAYQSVTSNFFSWCCRKFSEPTAKDPGSDDVMRGGEESREDEKPGTAKWYDRDFKYNMAARVIKSAEREQQKSKSSKLDEQIMQARLSDRVSALRFHPFEPHLAIVEGNFINIWDWEQGYSITTFDNRNTAHTRVNYLNFLNPHDNSLLLTGTGEGLVRVWKDYLSPRNVEMVTSWTALNNLIPMSNSPGLVMDWDDENQLLYASGNVDYIRIWDVNTEMKIRDVPLKYNTYTTSLSLNTYNPNVIAGGFIDGTVRLFDKRHPKNECEIRCLREHSTRIQKVVCPEGFENLLITASNHGDVVFWDLRNGGITNKLPTSQQSVELKAFDAHQRAEIMVCGHLGQQHLSALKYNGEVTPIKCHQGFMSQKNVNCTYLTFHPYKVKVAAANENNVVTVYGVRNSKKGDKSDE